MEKKINATYLSLEEVYAECIKLAKKVIHSGYSPDIIVAVARGGFAPARFLCDFLDVKELQSIQITHYAAGAEKMKDARVVSKNLNKLENKNILLVDDVNDSGETLSAAVKHLEHISMVKTAVLHEKENSSFKASWYGEKLFVWKWLIYPWAAKEDILNFLGKGDMAIAGVEQAEEFLKARYDLEIDKNVLAEILSFRTVKNQV